MNYIKAVQNIFKTNVLDAADSIGFKMADNQRGLPRIVRRTLNGFEEKLILHAKSFSVWKHPVVATATKPLPWKKSLHFPYHADAILEFKRLCDVPEVLAND